MQTLVVIQVVCLGLLIFREMRIDSPIIDFRVLGERNFTIACVVLFCALRHGVRLEHRGTAGDAPDAVRLRRPARPGW